MANPSTERKGTPVKQKRVTTLSDQLKRAEMAIVTDYRGMKMAELSDLRIQLRKNNSEFHVVKNTLVRIAEVESGVSGLESELSGTTAIAFCYGDVAATAKLLTDFADVEVPQDPQRPLAGPAHSQQPAPGCGQPTGQAGTAGPIARRPSGTQRQPARSSEQSHARSVGHHAGSHRPA